MHIVDVAGVNFGFFLAPFAAERKLEDSEVVQLDFAAAFNVKNNPCGKRC